MTRVVVGLLVDSEGRLFLQQRGGSKYNGHWEFPGGKVEGSESDVGALTREWFEELGVEIEVDPEVLATAELVFADGPGTLPLYEVRLVGGSLNARIGQLDLGWMSWEEAKSKLLTPATQWYLEYMQPEEVKGYVFNREALRRALRQSRSS